MGPKSRAPATDDTRAAMKHWLDNWKRVGPLLDAERVANLRKLDDAAAGRIAVDLWSMACRGSGDSGQGLASLKAALGRLAGRR